ncbi:MAG: hypothetical protein AAFW68_08080 [Pseudomonadota bacterium]
MKPLSHDDKIYAFKRATGAFAKSHHRWSERAASGLSDEELAEALQFELGVFGGSGGPGQMDIVYQGAGLKIWAGWDVFNHHETKPIFEGQSTIEMARHVYGIADPDDDQLALL